MNSHQKFAIIIGSTRQGRNGDAVGAWVAEQAAGRDASYDVVDLADFDLPLLWEPTVPAAAKKQYDSPQTQRWSDVIDSYDGYVMVTPEYNHSVPAAMKNAIDVLGPEWAGKAVTFAAYGADGGVRAVEHWRQILANLRLHCTRNIVSFSIFTDFGDDGFAPAERRTQELGVALSEFEKLSSAMARLRAPQTVSN